MLPVSGKLLISPDQQPNFSPIPKLTRVSWPYKFTSPVTTEVTLIVGLVYQQLCILTLELMSSQTGTVIVKICLRSDFLHA